MTITKRGNVLLKTPQRSSLLWREEIIDGSITIVIPFGTARFRVMQAILYDLALAEDKLQVFKAIKPRLIKLRSSGAEVWKQMNGYRTLQEITTSICEQFNCLYASTTNEVIAFCEEAHRIGIINADFPQPPKEGYLQALLADLEHEPYASSLGSPELKARVREVIRTFGQMIGDE